MNIPTICVFLLLQSVISIKPGFVHFADGEANVRKFQQVEPGKAIRTGPNSRVEIGLGPDSLLRLDENSAAVLESIDKADVSVRIESGTALVEVEKVDKSDRIRISFGDLKTAIDSKGVFRFSQDSVSVIDGKLSIVGTNVTLQKGWQFTRAGRRLQTKQAHVDDATGIQEFLELPESGLCECSAGRSQCAFTGYCQIRPACPDRSRKLCRIAAAPRSLHAP